MLMRVPAVPRKPPDVTFAYAPAAEGGALGLVHDQAYWISEARLTSTTGGTTPAKGVIDALSHGFGLGDPPSTAGANARAVPPVTYPGSKRTWGAPPAIPLTKPPHLALRSPGSPRLDLAP